jgi:hypothetical protein
MTKAAKQRRGRPFKTPLPNQRVSLGLKVTAEVKQQIDAAARASGRTQSQEAELLIERALQYDRIFAIALSNDPTMRRFAEAMRTMVGKHE